MSVYQRQLELEEKYSTASLIAGQQQVMDAFKQGRATDVGKGRIVLAQAYNSAHDEFVEWLSKPLSGIGGKFKKLLKVASPDVLVMAGLREIINGCASPEPIMMQQFLRQLGRIIESESMLSCMEKVSDAYTKRTVEYLDSAGTRSVSHRYRTFLKGAENMGLAWEQWSSEERVGTARLLLTILYNTGLFKWNKSGAQGNYFLAPSEELDKHFHEVQSAARAIVKYPPMLLPPMDWQGYDNGGYLTEWFRMHSPMCGIRYIKPEHKRWIVESLGAPEAQPVRDAMNKAQSVPYRVNQRVLTILRTATAMRVGILGLPSFVPAAQPDFPFQDGWLKENATAAELEQFQFWKTQMAAWYTSEAKRKGRQMGILGRINELVEYQTEGRLYFPTFIDWRGRLYFRSNLNPQSSDAVKGCLEFAEGKPLGKQGLKWLKVHVANCCGYDKHDADTKEKWCDEHWEEIKDFINNPLDVDAPEPDTAFTLLQAGLALQDALNSTNPEAYVCHVPVAMDATCSGLQHLSALTCDPVGAYYTNLINNNSDQKSDIYMRVADVARDLLPEFIDDVVVDHFWKVNEITRAMAKNPVMTYVYGATLLRCIDTIALNLVESGVEPIKEGSKVIYSMTALATPTGKALRKGVEQTVPESAKMMKYLQQVVRGNRDTCMRWMTPVGVPVVNWAEGTILKELKIRSMGVDSIILKTGDKTYNTRAASNGVVPNFVHSMDSAHLCMTINDFDGSILPIHDSFATHPSDVDSMHVSLRRTFVDMYKQFSITELLDFNDVDQEEFVVPSQGNLDLEVINNAPFMFC
jgi:DNA-directed RNA polymerase